MSTKLDQKLRETIGDIGEAAPGDTCCDKCAAEVNSGIAKIRQAFADAGYVSPEADQRKRNAQAELLSHLSESVAKLERHLLAPAYYGADGVIRMTGQEWQQRFGKAFKENLDSFVEFADIDMNVYNNGKEAAVTAALEAASRAAGIE